MKKRCSEVVLFLLLSLLFYNIAVVVVVANHADPLESFTSCFSQHVIVHDNLLHTQDSTSYTSVLQSTIDNNLFINSPSRPVLIVAATHESHVQATVVCGKKHKLHLRVRSGGHDFEGLSYRTVDESIPFVLLDMNHFQSITIDAEKKEAWAEAGVKNGQIQYSLAKTNPTFAFPSGSFPAVGFGGHISGGGVGPIRRRFGIAADHVTDCRIVDVHGRILDRKSMGEELFWAVRGGGGASFGVVLSYKLKLVEVPAKVTGFYLFRSKNEQTTELLSKWQEIVTVLPDSTYLSAFLQTSGGTREEREKAAVVVFQCLFLGEKDDLMALITSSFPELRLREEDCVEMVWAQSNLFLEGYTNITLENLLLRPEHFHFAAKTKYDFVNEPIPDEQWEEIWERMMELRTEVRIWFEPSGGKMHEIAEDFVPFPHRKGTLYKILYTVLWQKSDGEEATRRHLDWMKELYDYMTPYVSKNPRAAYINVKDLDLGMNKEFGKSYYSEVAASWGGMYFKDNLRRLAIIKGKVDPENYFWNEQSIPPLYEQVAQVKKTNIHNTWEASTCSADMS